MASEDSSEQDIFPPSAQLSVLHYLFFVVVYCLAKALSKILDKPLPWEDERILRADARAAQNEECMNEDLRVKIIKCYRYLAKLINFFMLFCCLQALFVIYCFSDKCRWSKVALALAEHYKSVDPDSRPRIVSRSDYSSYLAIFCFLNLINAGGIYVVHKSKMNHQEELAEVGDYEIRPRISLVPFTILWFMLAYRAISYCTFSEEAFMKFFVGEANAEPIGYIKFGNTYADL